MTNLVAQLKADLALPLIAAPMVTAQHVVLRNIVD